MSSKPVAFASSDLEASMQRLFKRVITVAAVAQLAVSCTTGGGGRGGSKVECKAGETLTCECPDGSSGVRECTVDGFLAKTCSGCEDIADVTEQPDVVEQTDTPVTEDATPDTKPEEDAEPDAGPPTPFDAGPTDLGTSIPDVAPPPQDLGPPQDIEEPEDLPPTPDLGPPDAGPPPDTQPPEPDIPPDPPDPPSVETCYPGPANSWDVCFDLVPLADIADPAYSWPNPAGSPDPIQYAEPNWLLDLNAASGSTKVAANFALNELMSATKGQWGVFSPQAVFKLQQVRTDLGVPLHVNSGFRSPGYNSGIDGAAKYSRHQFGDAVDVTTKGATSLATIEQACKQNDASFTLMYDTHVHCDWRNLPLDIGYWSAP